MRETPPGAHSLDKQTIEQLVASDNITDLLTHSDLFFELRCRTDELILYLQQGKTLSYLFNLIFVESNDERAAQAVQLIKSCENVNEIMSKVAEDRSLLGLPFFALQSLSDELRGDMDSGSRPPWAPITPPVHLVSRASQILTRFSQVLKSIMWTSNRFCMVVSFLIDNAHYLYLWLQFLDNPAISDLLRYLFYDTDSRTQLATDSVEVLCTRTDVLDLLMSNVLLPDVSQDYLSSAVEILCKIMVRNIPGASKRVLSGVSSVASYAMHHHFPGIGAQLHLQPLTDLVACAMSYMSVQAIRRYDSADPAALSAVPAVVLAEREAQVLHALGVALDQSALVSTIPDVTYVLDMNDPALKLTPLGIPSIDEYEQEVYRLYFHVLSILNHLPVQLELLQNSNGSEISMGNILLFRFAARLLAISADMRNSLVPDEPSMICTSNNVIMASPYAYSADSFSRLPEAGLYTSSGTPKIPISRVVRRQGVPIHIGVLSIVRKLVALGLHTISISCISKFSTNSTVHFCALQILQSMLQYGSAVPEATLAVVRDPAVMFRFESASYGALIKFKNRSSSLIHLVQLARYILRVCFNISDQTESVHRVRFLQPNSLCVPLPDMSLEERTVWQHGIYPTSLRCALRLSLDLSRGETSSESVYFELLQVIKNTPGFVRFSETFLEQDEKAPRLFFDGIARHIHGVSDTDSILGDL